MAIVFAASADIQDLSAWTTTAGASISTDTARTGARSFKLSANDGKLQASIGGSSATMYVKAGDYFATAQNDLYKLRFYEETTNHVTIRFNSSSGTIAAYRGDSTLLGTADGGLTAGSWFCIEAKVVIHDSAGSVDVKINGTTKLSLSGQDTKNGGTGYINVVDWYHSYGVSRARYVDDIVIRNDDWIGTGGLYLLTADGDGSDTGWTASTGARWDCVDEVPPSATDHISTDAGTANTKNTCTFSNLGFTPGSIASVSVLAKAKLSEAGTGNIRAILKSNATYANGASTALDVTESWAALHTLVDPNGGGAWGEAGVNAISAGVETL